MAHTLKAVFQCPRCAEGITSATRPKICPACKYEFVKQEQSGYAAPLTLTEQYNKYRNQPEYIRFVQSLGPEKTNDILNDALTIVASLPGKSADVSDIRLVVEIAKSIGEIATKYDEFLRAGGKHTHSLINPQNKKETQDGNSAPSGDGGTPS